MSSIGEVSADGMWRWDGASWQPSAARATDYALRTGTCGLGASLAVAVSALFLVFTGRLLTLESRLLAGAAVLFGAWLAARASSWLLWPDAAMALVLLGAAASLARSGSLLDTGIAEAAARSIHAFIHGVGGAAFIVRPLRSTRDRLTLLGPLARGLLIRAPMP